MKNRIHVVTFAFWVLLLAAPARAEAHLMVAQRGTINVVDDGAFVVVSVPVAAFAGVDDDGDERLSRKELQAHSREISAQVERRLQMRSDSGPRPLQGLLLNLGDDHSNDPSAQLVVMGRFALDSSGEPIRLRTSLFGDMPAERQLAIVAKRDGESMVMVLTPDHPESALFPEAVVGAAAVE